MMEKLNNMTIAEMVEHRDFAVAVFSIPEQKREPVPYRFHTAFPYEGKHEKDKAKIYDEMMAEILGEHNAEKAKVRNRRKADRKAKRKSGAYVKRNGGDFRKDEHYAGDGRMWHDTYNWDLSKSQMGGKVRERSLRKDFITELHQHEDAIAEMYDYLAFAEDHAERAEMLRNKLLDLPVDHGNHSRNFAESIVAEIRYEEIRIKDMDTMAKMILKGECY